MKKSVWTDSIEIPQFDSLNGDRKTDVLIIGGGLCGLLCAYFLQRAEIDYILVEGDRIAKGITKNTTAKITFLHGLVYSNIINSIGFNLGHLANEYKTFTMLNDSTEGSVKFIMLMDGISIKDMQKEEIILNQDKDDKKEN